MLRIIRDAGTNVTLSDLCTASIKRYEEMFAPEAGHKEAIIKILIKEGKGGQMATDLRETPLERVITPENYYLSLLDIFILTKIYTLSCIVLSKKNLKGFESPKLSFIQNEKGGNIYLILST